MTLTRNGRAIDADAHFMLVGPGRTEDFGDGEWGISFDLGLVAEHVASFVAAGGEIRTVASGRQYGVRSFDRLAVPVVCGEFIEVITEDGRETGRCGGRDLDAETGACQGHAAEIREWAAMSAREQAARERDLEGAV